MAEVTFPRHMESHSPLCNSI